MSVTCSLFPPFGDPWTSCLLHSQWRVCFPHLHCSGFRLLYRKWALSCVHFPGLSCPGSGSQVLHKGADSVGPAFCVLPWSEQLRQPGAWWVHSLHVQRNLSPLGPSLSFQEHPVQCTLCLFWGADLWLRPSWQMSTILNLRKSLVRNWKVVCRLVGDAISGAKFAPFWPGTHLPPASGGGWAGPSS